MKKSREKNSIIVLIAILFIAIAMRAPMGGIGPLIGKIQSDLALSSSRAGFITTLPLLSFALASPIAGIVIVKIGCRRVIPLSLLAIIIGIVLRSNFSSFGMFLGTAIIGVGTGFLNIGIPTFIKQFFPSRIGFAMGVYSISLTFASALTAAIIQPLEASFSSWQYALLSLSIPALLALFLSFISISSIKEEGMAKNSSTQKSSIFTFRNISIAIYMGLQSLLFFSLLTWYPTMMKEQYSMDGNVGMLITIMQIASLLPAYLTPVLSQRFSPGKLASCFAFLFAPGILLSGFGHSGFALMLGTILQGLAVGATFSMAVTLCAMNGKDASETARITSFGQCFGYILASLGPSGFGKIYDALGSWNYIYILMAILALLMASFGYFAGRKL